VTMPNKAPTAIASMSAWGLTPGLSAAFACPAFRKTPPFEAACLPHLLHKRADAFGGGRNKLQYQTINRRSMH
jgi:hypothetical protein